MAEELYENPREQVSQGDILELLPHVYIDKPLLALHQEGETIFRASGEPYLSFDDKRGQLTTATCRRSKAILLNHDCEIDKPQVKRWLTCPVVPIVRLKLENRERAKRNRIYSMLYLPKHRDVLEESFVDFNQVTTLDAEFIKTARRLTSLSDSGRRALYAQFIRWLTRWELRDLLCPSCGTTFNPAIALPVRTP